MKHAIPALLAAVLTSVLGAIDAAAESVDCTHPTLPVARAVCGNPTLRAADRDESASYDAALAATLDRAALCAA